jgi:hypothetical protein
MLNYILTLMHSFPVADNATNFPTWNLTVNDTSPIWAYVRDLLLICIHYLSHLYSAAKRLRPATVVPAWFSL